MRGATFQRLYRSDTLTADVVFIGLMCPVSASDFKVGEQLEERRKPSGAPSVSFRDKPAGNQEATLTTPTLPSAESKQPTADEFLRLAQIAAAERRPNEMLEALAASGYLDGLVRRLERHWSDLPRHEIEDSVAEAVDSAYDAVAKGRSVSSIGGWLWKAALNIASDRWEAEYRIRADGDADAVELEQSPDDDDERLADYRRAEALRLARQLLPRIGQGQVIDVMTMVIDAVEHGAVDLPAAAIAEALGLSEGAVRSLLSRGFERLQREAQREGIAFPVNIPSIID